MIENSLAPTLLLAMPQMTDPNFARTVVLLCRHEAVGAMGLVMNRPTDALVSSVVELDPPIEAKSGMVVWSGGPVDQSRGWLLLGYDPAATDAIRIAPGLYLSASLDLLRDLMQADNSHADSARFFLGYSGWGEGQLESELAASVWLTTEVTNDLIFRTTPEKMWDTAIRTLGVDPHALQVGTGVH